MSDFVAVYDACVLYPAPLRDLLMHLALSGLYRARWSTRIHDEWMTALLEKRSDLSREDLEWTRRKMDELLAPYGIAAQHPDQFIEHIYDLNPAAVCKAVRDQRASLKNPPKTVEELFDTYLQQGLATTVAALRQSAELL